MNIKYVTRALARADAAWPLQSALGTTGLTATGVSIGFLQHDKTSSRLIQDWLICATALCCEWRRALIEREFWN